MSFVAIPEEVLFADEGIFPRPIAPEGKSKRKCVSLAVKYAALLDLETHSKTRREVCQDLNISHGTLATWVKCGSEIKSAFLDDRRAPNCKRLRKSNFTDIENAVLEWCLKKQAEQQKLTTASIARKANQIAKYLGYAPETFRGSTGWAERFRLRHGFTKHNYPPT